MEKNDIIDIADGLRLIEEGVEKIQDVMRKTKMKSLKDIAVELIPVLKENDDSLADSIMSRLD